MSDILFRQLQSLQLSGLLKDAGGDPILEAQLRQRVEEANRELENARKQGDSLLPKEIQTMSRVAVFLRGGGVEGQIGIRPSLAGAALLHYERMFVEQAIHDEREFARSSGRQRRPRGSKNPELLFIGTPRGSFGLEFTPKPQDDTALLEVHAGSLEHLASSIEAVADSNDDGLAKSVEQIPAGVLQHLKQFFKVLSTHGAEIRLASSTGKARTLDSSQVQRAAERLEKSVIQTEIALTGTFRGVARESGVFDLLDEHGELITGTVAEQLTEEDLERIDRMVNELGKAKLQKTTIMTVSGPSATKYVLLDAEVLADEPPPDE